MSSCQLSDCGGEFYQVAEEAPFNSSLHSNSYSGEIICFCKKSFASITGLKAHCRIHSASERLKCQNRGCNRSFLYMIASLIYSCCCTPSRCKRLSLCGLLYREHNGEGLLPPHAAAARDTPPPYQPPIWFKFIVHAAPTPLHTQPHRTSTLQNTTYTRSDKKPQKQENPLGQNLPQGKRSQQHNHIVSILHMTVLVFSFATSIVLVYLCCQGTQHSPVQCIPSAMHPN